MARARKLAVNSFVRGQIRDLVREGNSRTNVANTIIGRFPNVNRNLLAKEITQEQQRQARVDAVMNLDKRRNVNLGQLLGCTGPNQTIEAGLVILFRDETTGKDVRFHQVVNLTKQGRAANIINDAIAQAVADAVGWGYQPPGITSASTTGTNRYRLDYVECR